LNPKTGKMNAPKKGNYYHFAYHYLNTENNHIENAVLRFSGYESVNSGCKFFAENYEALELNAEMVKGICAYMFTAVRVSASFTSAETKPMMEVLNAPIKKLLHGFKTGENVFAEVFIDTEAIKSLEASYTGEPAVKFTVTEYVVA